ncbi:hypothetical protein CgunFtcFv8_026212 [Champsocephalus gunnari]|nr:hypothetical protein CgunFtcFv8_026212 [Champsocephalus gunnari]
MTESDEIEAYLTAFERTAEREGWPRDSWADLVGPFLLGPAQQAYFDLPPDQAKVYFVLKREILARYGYSLAARAQRFHDWKYKPELSARAQMYDLGRVTRAWLTCDPGKLSVLERIMMDKYIRSLPYETKKMSSQQNPASLDELVDVVESHMVTADLLKSTRPDTELGRKASGEASRTRRAREPRWEPEEVRRRQSYLPEGQPRCYQCGEIGHIARDCPGKDELMPTAHSSGERPCHLLDSCWVQESSLAQMIPVKVNGKDAEALVDSGSVVSLIQPHLLDHLPSEETVAVSCVHGDTKLYPTCLIHLTTVKGSCELKVGVVALPVPVLVGRDCPLYKRLQHQKEGRPKNPRRAKGKREKGQIATLGTSPQQFPKVVCAVPEEQRGNQSSSADKANDNPFIAFPGDLSTGEEEGEVALIPSLKGQFGTAQMEDPNLLHACSNVTEIEGKPVPGVGELTCPHFLIKNNLLYYAKEVEGQRRDLLVVPKQYVSTVLHLAHSHVLGAHLGVEKTRQRIGSQFHWPGVVRAIEDYCRTCVECQKMSPKPHFKNPLIPLPIIDVPFSRIAMDLVGPLVKSAREHQYILVILDYATRYPEAIPLRNMTTRVIARELIHLFSRVGIPKEILTDQGTPFMSKIMKDLCRLFKVKQLRTSVYHPQTDGLVERFNKTLKSMLKKVVDKDGRNWDQLLPYVLFSIREVPQASTGFSPFELLYGRQPRGLLDIAKEAWEEQPRPHRSNQDPIGA